VSVTPTRYKRHPDNQNNDIQHNGTQHKGLICDTQHTWHSITILYHYDKSHYDEWHFLCVVMLSVVMLNAVSLNVVALDSTILAMATLGDLTQIGLLRYSSALLSFACCYFWQIPARFCIKLGQCKCRLNMYRILSSIVYIWV
jgi:hypothetical protein